MLLREGVDIDNVLSARTRAQDRYFQEMMRAVEPLRPPMMDLSGVPQRSPSQLLEELEETERDPPTMTATIDREDPEITREQTQRNVRPRLMVDSEPDTPADIFRVRQLQPGSSAPPAENPNLGDLENRASQLTDIIEEERARRLAEATRRMERARRSTINRPPPQLPPPTQREREALRDRGQVLRELTITNRVNAGFLRGLAMDLGRIDVVTDMAQSGNTEARRLLEDIMIFGS